MHTILQFSYLEFGARNKIIIDLFQVKIENWFGLNILFVFGQNY